MRARASGGVAAARAVEVDHDHVAAVVAIAQQQVLHVQVGMPAARVVEAPHGSARTRCGARESGRSRAVAEVALAVACAGLEARHDDPVPREGLAPGAGEDGLGHRCAGGREPRRHDQLAERALRVREGAPEPRSKDTAARHGAHDACELADLHERGGGTSGGARRRREQRLHVRGIEEPRRA